MDVTVRSYRPEDYDAVAGLYKQSDFYGGQYDDNRDSQARLNKKSIQDPEGILVCESSGKIVGTISLVEDGRVAWLFRFAVEKSKQEREIVKALYEAATEIFKKRGHRQILVYSPIGNEDLDKRYSDLEMVKGGAYTCFWKDID